MKTINNFEEANRIKKILKKINYELTIKVNRAGIYCILFNGKQIAAYEHNNEVYGFLVGWYRAKQEDENK